MKLISMLLIKLALLLSPCEHHWTPKMTSVNDCLLRTTPAPLVEFCPRCGAQRITAFVAEVRYE